MTLTEAAEKIGAAATAEQLFGGHDAPDPRTVIQQRYRELARAVHPDCFRGKAHDLAMGALSRLNELRQQALERIDAESYGKAPDVILRGKVTVTLGEQRYSGDIADIFDGRTDDERVTVKLARSAADNDLIETEADCLSLMGEADGVETYGPYLPILRDSVRVGDGKTPLRRANVLFTGDRLDTVRNQLRSFEEVRNTYPSGVDAHHAAWMLNRLFEVLGFCHSVGIIHGAVTPQHCLVDPGTHGLVLIDWCFAVKDGWNGRPLKAVPSDFSSWYPPEVAAKQPASFGTDIYMAAQCGLYLLGANPPETEVATGVPDSIVSFLRGCLIRTPNYRPTSAWDLREAFDDVLRRVFGPRRFHTFTMPGG